MRRLNRLATLSRAVSSGATSAATQHRHYQLAQPAALFSTFSSCQSQGFAQKIVDRLGLSFAGGVAGFSAAAPSLAQDAKPQAKEQPRSEKFGDVVLYQYEACPFCNKVKAFLDYYRIPYKVVEVNPISKKEIKWSDYKKVPILKVDAEQMVDSSDIIDKLFQRIHLDNASSQSDEQKKWRAWVDNHLVHVLSPNIYRTTSEALESFDYITTQVGQNNGGFTCGPRWAVPGQDQCHAHAQIYSLVGLVAGKNVLIEAALGNFTEKLVAKYVGAAAMYFVSKKLKKRHNITDERASLYEAAEIWVDALNGRHYLGGSKPNLADLAVFGVLRPIRHLKSGRDMVEHTRIGDWYTRMESSVGSSRIKE